MANDELDAIRARDARGLVSGAIEQTGDAVSASIDRRALLAEVDRLLDWQRQVVEELKQWRECHPLLDENGKTCTLIEETGHE